MSAAQAYVVDASVAAKWHLRDEENVREAASLLRDFGNGAFELLAPDHIRYEVTNAITGAVERGRLTEEEGTEAIFEFLSLRLTTFGDNDLLADAYRLARRYGCAFYDSVYLALAQRMNRPLVLADRPFYRRVRHLPLVIWIAQYRSG